MKRYYTIIFVFFSSFLSAQDYFNILSTDVLPSSTPISTIMGNKTDGRFYRYNGSEWIPLNVSGSNNLVTSTNNNLNLASLGSVIYNYTGSVQTINLNFTPSNGNTFKFRCYRVGGGTCRIDISSNAPDIQLDGDPLYFHPTNNAFFISNGQGIEGEYISSTNTIYANRL